MSIYLALIYPILASVICLIFFYTRIKWWETLTLVGAAFIIIFISDLIFGDYNYTEPEYWGNYVTKTCFEEEWVEYDHETCTESYPCGTDSKGNTEYCTRTYDCSHYDTHPEEYYVMLNDGRRIDVTKNKYWDLRKRFGTNTFVDMHREDYYDMSRSRCKDGDMYESCFQGEFEKIEPVVTRHDYVNRVIHSKSLFNYTEVSDSLKKTLPSKLPPINPPYFADAVRGDWYPMMWEANELLQKYNGLYGKEKECRIQIILMKNQPQSSGELLEQYWKGGNMNEFNIAIGIKDGYNRATWCRVISWTENQTLKIETRDYIMLQDTLQLIPTVNWVAKNIAEGFNRKNFEAFKYLKVDPPLWAVIMVHIIVLLMSIALAAWSVVNEFEN